MKARLLRRNQAPKAERPKPLMRSCSEEQCS
jgi:hypothetical protein